MKWPFGKGKTDKDTSPSSSSNGQLHSNHDVRGAHHMEGLNDYQKQQVRDDYNQRALAALSEREETLANIPPDYLSTIEHLQAGTFIKPEGNQWSDHTATITEHRLNFNPTHYAWFDGTIAETLTPQLAAVTNPSASEYERFEPLRMNLAVLRNFLYAHFFPEGTYDEGRDAHHMSHIAQIAVEVANMLSQGSDIVPDMFQPNTVALSVANQEGIGASELYARLYAMNQGYDQTRLLHGVRETFMDYRPRDWQLPPIEQTPFARVKAVTEPTDVNYINYQAQTSGQHEGAMQNAAKAAVTFSVEDLGRTTPQGFRSVEELSTQVKRDAIKIAKDILDNLKVQFANMSIKELIDSGDIPLIDTLLAGVTTVALTFDHHLGIALKLDPNLANDAVVKEANDALGIFKYHTAMQGATKATMKAIAAEHRGEQEEAAALRAEASSLRSNAAAMPESYKTASNMKVSDLLTNVQKGMDKVVARMQEVTQAGFATAGSDANGLGRDKQTPASQQGSQIDNSSMNNAANPSANAAQQQTNQQQQQIAIQAAAALRSAREARQAARAASREAQAASGARQNPAGMGGQQNTPNAPRPNTQAQDPQMAGAGGAPTAMGGGNTTQSPAMQQQDAQAAAARRNTPPPSAARQQATVKMTVKPPTAKPPTPAGATTPVQGAAIGTTPPPPNMNALIDPNMLKSLQGAMNTKGMKENDALAPSSASRTIATLKAEQDAKRSTELNDKQQQKTTQKQTQAEQERTAKEQAERAEREKAAAAQQPQQPAWKKPSLTR
jgi:hypothetical protein